MPPLGAILGVVSAGLGIASTIQGLSSAAASKRDIKIQNQAAAQANTLVGGINKSLVDATKRTNEILTQGFKGQNEIIERSNRQIQKANVEDQKQFGFQRDLTELGARVQREEAIREAQILAAQQESEATLTGAQGSSAEAGGAGSLQSQLGRVVGIQSQETEIGRSITESSIRRSEAIGRAQQAETDIRLQENVTQRRLARQQERIQLLRNRADRIKEFASLDPKRFLKSQGIDFGGRVEGLSIGGERPNLTPTTTNEPKDKSPDFTGRI